MTPNQPKKKPSKVLRFEDGIIEWTPAKFNFVLSRVKEYREDK